MYGGRGKPGSPQLPFAQRVRQPAGGSPAKSTESIYRRNLDGSEPRYYLSNDPEDNPLEPWPTRLPVAHRNGVETEKSNVGRRVRDPHLGGMASSRRPMPAGRKACNRLGGKTMPDHAPWPETPGDAAPGRLFLTSIARCNSGSLQRITYTILPANTGIRLLGVARNPANGFPARLLGPVDIQNLT